MPFDPTKPADHSPLDSDTADAARAMLAQLCLKRGDTNEAARYLYDINPDGAMSGARSMLSQPDRGTGQQPPVDRRSLFRRGQR